MQRQGRPFPVTRQACRVSFGEKPLETSQRARERLSFDEQESLMGEGRGVDNRKLAGPGHEGEKYLDVARESVGGVQAR